MISRALEGWTTFRPHTLLVNLLNIDENRHYKISFFCFDKLNNLEYRTLSRLSLPELKKCSSAKCQLMQITTLSHRKIDAPLSVTQNIMTAHSQVQEIYVPL